MSVVTLSVNDSTRGAVTGGGTYSDGTQITVRATANSGSLFACWSIGELVVSSNPSYTFSVSGNVTLKAHFYSEIDGVKIYGICGANCRHRVLSIGQVISLIQEMAANGWQVPTGYIPKTAVNSIVEQSTGKELKLFINTQKAWADYNGDKTDVLFFPTDDTTLEDVKDKLTELENFKYDIENGEVAVPKADKADKATKDGDGNVISETYHKSVLWNSVNLEDYDGKPPAPTEEGVYEAFYCTNSKLNYGFGACYYDGDPAYTSYFPTCEGVEKRKLLFIDGEMRVLVFNENTNEWRLETFGTLFYRRISALKEVL